MSNGEVITLGINADGELVHISQVKAGKACNCVCKRCHNPLIARLGNGGRTPHFAHLKGSDCVGAQESALHQLAKEVLAKELVLMDPQSHTIRFDRIEIEKYDSATGLKPDCVGYIGDRNIWIEFKRTHEVDSDKTQKIIANKIDTIEIDINDCDGTTENMRSFLCQSSDRRKWIYNHLIPTDEQSKTRNLKLDQTMSFPKNYPMTFALTGEGKLVSAASGSADSKFYCPGCGQEVKFSKHLVHFEHVDLSSVCTRSYYRYKACKLAIEKKFNRSSKFSIVLSGDSKCPRHKECPNYTPGQCRKHIEEKYELKALGYDKCELNVPSEGPLLKYDAVITRGNSSQDAIYVKIVSGGINEDTEYNVSQRQITIRIDDDHDIFNVLHFPIKVESFENFQFDNYHDVNCFTLYESGKHYVERIDCSKIAGLNQKSVIQRLFFDANTAIPEVEGLRWCLENKLPACYCKICKYLKTDYKYPFCIRYKTQNTPKYPLQESPVDCPFFKKK